MHSPPHARPAPRPLLWSVRVLSIELGHTVLELAADSLTARVRLDVYDGGGFFTSHGVWRVGDAIWSIVQAGEG